MPRHIVVSFELALDTTKKHCNSCEHRTLDGKFCEIFDERFDLSKYTNERQPVRRLQQCVEAEPTEGFHLVLGAVPARKPEGAWYMEKPVFKLEGTGKNEGHAAFGTFVRSNIYGVFLSVPRLGKNGKVLEMFQVEFFRSSRQTAAAKQNKTSWRIAEQDHKRFDQVK